MARITTCSNNASLAAFAAEELQRYLAQLTPPPPFDFILGCRRELQQRPDIPPRFHERLEQLHPEGFAVETVAIAGRNTLIIGAAAPAGLLYGVYDVLEKLGFCFRSTGDILAAAPPTPEAAPLSYDKNPLVKRRGYLTHHCYPQLGLHSVADMKAMIDQMAKMKLNTLIWFTWPSEPWLWYEYRGEGPLFGDVSPVETGSMFWRFIGFYTQTREMPVGGDRFPHDFLAAPEFQNCRTSRELFEAGRDYLRAIIAHAHQRNVEFWYSFDATTMTPNHGRFARTRHPRPFQEVCGALGTPQDPVLAEINRARLQALAETYPDLDRCLVLLTEDYYEDPYPENQALYDRERPRYDEVIPAFRQHWRCIAELSQDQAGESIESALRFDIANVEIIKDWLTLRDKAHPDLPMGILSIGKGYLLPLLHKMFPEDIAFADLEASGVWTPQGVPMELLGNMGRRERLVVPRIDDDGSVVGLQFVATEFVTDRVITGCVEHGATGFCAQQYRLRGSEHNSSFLAEAAWEADLDTAGFYRRYAERLFGAQAAPPIAAAFLIMEENDKILGWRGQRSLNFDTCATPEMSLLRQFARQKNPFDGPPYQEIGRFQQRQAIFQAVTARIDQARNLFVQAHPHVTPSGRPEWNYLVSRLDVYTLLAQTIISMNDAFIGCRRAFDCRPDRHEQFLAALEQVVADARQAYDLSVKAAQEQARHLDHPAELGVLAYLNSGLIKRTAAFQRFVGNLAAFHHGRPYWTPVRWAEVFAPRLNENSDFTL